MPTDDRAITITPEAFPRVSAAEPDWYARHCQPAREPLVITGLAEPNAGFMEGLEGTGSSDDAQGHATLVRRAGNPGDEELRRGLHIFEVPFPEYRQRKDELLAGYTMMTPLDKLPPSVRAAFADNVCPATAIWSDSRVFIAGPQKTAQTHHDAFDNLFMLLRGEKRWLIAAPSQRRNLYQNSLLSSLPNFCQADPFAPDYERHPRLRGATFIEYGQQPGETLFLPRLWYHAVANESYAVGVNCWYARPAQWPLVQAVKLAKWLKGYYKVEAG